MSINELCATIKDKVASDLQMATRQQRSEILIAALYELDRSVLPALGPPKKTDEYTKRQTAVVDLITFIALHLIRGEDRNCRGVTVLSEVAEGCPDPLLKKKLAVYAQELLAKPAGQPGRPEVIDFPRIFFIVGMVVLGVVLVFSAWPGLLTAPGSQDTGFAVAPQPARQAPITHNAPHAPAQPAPGEAVAGRERGGEEGRPPERGGGEAKSMLAVQSETVTRVRVVNSQVLVPVTLKNGGESVRVELVLDTGATRTSIHEELAGRLRIDVKGTRLSQSELADGRIVASRVARIDSLSVGPHAMTSAEVELIQYKGSDGVHDGLLGMDFLGKRRYQIDMDHELIRWF